MKDKQETGANESQSSAGMFDNLPGTSQSGGESEFDGKSQDTTQTDKNVQRDSDTTQTEEGSETTTEEQGEGSGEGHKEEAGEGEGKPISVAGRDFKDVTELSTAYENSSKEGLRLSRITKDLKAEIASLKSKVFEMEEKSDSKFPEAMSDEQLELLPSHKQTEYLLKKREWEKAKEARDAERKTHKEGLGKEEAVVRETQEENVRTMESSPEKYPGFKELEATRKMVLDETPALARLPEGPYIAWLIAKGLDSLNTKAEAEGKANESKEKAKSKANADAGSTRAPAGKNTSSTTEELPSAVKAYREKNSVF